jgi:hypothetical protein
MGKDKMEREGMLPMCLKVTLAALDTMEDLGEINRNGGVVQAVGFQQEQDASDDDSSDDEGDMPPMARSDHGDDSSDDSSTMSTMSDFLLNSREHAVYAQIEAEMQDNGGSDYNSDAIWVIYAQAEAELEAEL